MTKLITYNISNLDKKYLNEFINLINEFSPDVLLLNEVGWTRDDKNILKSLSSKIKLKYYDISISRKKNSNVILFSNCLFKKNYKISSMINAGIISNIELDFGDISIAGIHLAQNTEDTRLNEIKKIISYQKNYKYKLIMGDFNSISPYNSIRSSNKFSSKKHIIRHDVIRELNHEGYVDSAVIAKKVNSITVPVTTDNEIIYHDLRLDYIFLSDSLKKRIINYEVIINKSTNFLSDHYPVMLQIN